MGTPLVSVLLPVRDGAPQLAEALASLSAQTFEDFETLVVDDGSRDDSGAIAEAYARADPRFRVLRQEPKGIVAALERARAEALGTLLALREAVAAQGRRDGVDFLAVA
ncbi:MAG: glycosyltransferase family 2 protein [Gaiellaceae bacterium]